MNFSTTFLLRLWLLFSGSIIAISGKMTKTVCEDEVLQIECQPGKRIRIKNVFYGRTSLATCFHTDDTSGNVECWSKEDSKARVEEKCNYRQKCDVTADSQFFSEPCEGTFKYLTITYQCLEDRIVQKFACENHYLDINCPEDKIIKINSATFGRNKPKVCSQTDEESLTLTCLDDAQKTADLMIERCEGRSTCTNFASTKLFGDPCPGVRKFLDVSYYCLPR